MTHEQEMEQAALELVNEYSALHTVNGEQVSCYVGRERYELDQVVLKHRAVRTFAGSSDELTVPVPDGQVEIDGVVYIVETVMVTPTVFTSTLYRLR